MMLWYNMWMPNQHFEVAGYGCLPEHKLEVLVMNIENVGICGEMVLIKLELLLGEEDDGVRGVEEVEAGGEGITTD